MQQDARKMTFSEGELRTVICIHVLEHMPEDRKALSELARIIRPGGHMRRYGLDEDQVVFAARRI
jgi:ubiquinone/menaquinone biosynthesis C-methylase UbiE